MKKLKKGDLVWVAGKVCGIDDGIDYYGNRVSSGKGIEVDIYDPITQNRHQAFTTVSRIKRRNP